MHLSRIQTKSIRAALKNNPVVALLGPRQCGKSTLVQKLIKNRKAVYLDLENSTDLSKLSDPTFFLEEHTNILVCLDEIQRVPEFFVNMRPWVDENKKNGMALVLGSASKELLQQSSETLAGRITYIELTPFLLSEVYPGHSQRKLWLRGGYPRSLLAKSDEQSLQWRIDFIKTYIEKDIPQLGFQVKSINIERLWSMLAHLNGALLNSSNLGNSLGITNKTIRGYIELLKDTFVIRILQPYHGNLKKRMIKAPKIYIRDTGLLHSLLKIHSFDDLLGHPAFGASFESLVIENILSLCSNFTEAFFYRTAKGNEIDLILKKGQDLIAIEMKATKSPQLTTGFYTALKDLGIKKTYIIYLGNESYKINKDIQVCSLHYFLKNILVKSGF